MAINSDIDKNSLEQLKSNILVMGPYGVGKTTIKNSLMTSLDPIPVVEISLTGDYSTDIKTIIRKLITNADGNMFLAVQGIVVYDNINMDNSSYDENSDSFVMVFNDYNGDKIYRTKAINLKNYY